MPYQTSEPTNQSIAANASSPTGNRSSAGALRYAHQTANGTGATMPAPTPLRELRGAPPNVAARYATKIAAPAIASTTNFRSPDGDGGASGNQWCSATVTSLAVSP